MTTAVRGVREDKIFRWHAVGWTAGRMMIGCTIRPLPVHRRSGISKLSKKLQLGDRFYLGLEDSEESGATPIVLRQFTAGKVFVRNWVLLVRSRR